MYGIYLAVFIERNGMLVRREQVVLEASRPTARAWKDAICPEHRLFLLRLWMACVVLVWMGACCLLPMLAYAGAGSPQKAEVSIQDIRGIHLLPYNFTLPIFGKKIAVDELAKLLPQDQYAVFFPSFGHFAQGMAMLSENGRFVQGMAILSENGRFAQGLERPSKEGRLAKGAVSKQTSAERQDIVSRVLRRYQRQLCFDVVEFSKSVASKKIRGVAMTGGDVDFVEGTDITLLFQTSDPKGFREALRCFATGRVVTKVQGEIEDLMYAGVASAHREISSFVMVMGDVVALSNSVAALRRVAHARYEPKESLAALDQYRFFRMRYLYDSEERVFLLMGDEALRLLGSPHLRVLQWRRAQVREQIRQQTALRRTMLLQGKHTARRLDIVPKIPDGGGLWLEGDRIFSEYYGSLRFMTPLRELEIMRITPAEKKAYEAWRGQYESKRRSFFDPIAMRISERDRRLRIDFSVIPLMTASVLRRWFDPMGSRSDAKSSEKAFAFLRRLFEAGGVRSGGSTKASASATSRPTTKNVEVLEWGVVFEQDGLSVRTVLQSPQAAAQ